MNQTPTHTTPIASHAASFYDGPTLELVAEEISARSAKRESGRFARLMRLSDRLCLRIALPPLALWAVLYSLVEYLV